MQNNNNILLLNYIFQLNPINLIQFNSINLFYIITRSWSHFPIDICIMSIIINYSRPMSETALIYFPILLEVFPVSIIRKDFHTFSHSSKRTLVKLLTFFSIPNDMLLQKSYSCLSTMLVSLFLLTLNLSFTQSQNVKYSHNISSRKSCTYIVRDLCHYR